MKGGIVLRTKPVQAEPEYVIGPRSEQSRDGLTSEPGSRDRITGELERESSRVSCSSSQVSWNRMMYIRTSKYPYGISCST
jgi:hypothetical protein